MKAKDYFEKYRDVVNNTSLVVDMFNEFSDEAKKIMTQRKVFNDGAALSVLKEQNQKWNSLSNIFEKEMGYQVLQRDAFIKFWDEKIRLARYGK